jgi:predicted nucleotidyltransferase component of viral defense system
MAKIDYPGIYKLQDQVLTVVCSAATTGFYLTGGTCLNRFYLERRYSDDLDFFTNDNHLFRDDVRLLRQALAEASIAFEVAVDSRDFVRLMVEGVLKVDLVNDRVYRFGKSVNGAGNIVLDNLGNLGANKICAVLGRDDPKDIFDLFTISCIAGTHWPDIMSAAAKKCVVDAEELRFRLESFPLSLIDILPVTRSHFVADFQRDYKKMVACLLEAI